MCFMLQPAIDTPAEKVMKFVIQAYRDELGNEESRMELLNLLLNQRDLLSGLLSEDAVNVLINVIQSYSRPKDFTDN